MMILVLTICSIAQAAPMDPQKAQNILNDPRTAKLIDALAVNFDAKCIIPQADKIDANQKCNGGGDMSSCYYTFSIPCSGTYRLSALTITAEFATPLNKPLDMTFTTVFRQ